MDESKEDDQQGTELPEAVDLTGLQPNVMQQVIAPAFANNFNTNHQPVNLFGLSPSHLGLLNSGRNSAPTLPVAGHSPGVHHIAPVPRMQPAPPAMPPSAAKRPAKKPPKKPPGKAGGRGKGGGQSSKFNARETQLLLTAVDKCLPIGQPAWKAVEAHYNPRRPEGRIERDYLSLKRRHTNLHETKPPTGDPDVPEEVLEAKRIEEKIVDKSSAMVATGMEDDDRYEIDFSLSDDEATNTNTGNLKTTGLEETNEETKEESKEEADEAKKRGPGRPKNSKNKDKNESEIVQALLITDKVNSRREKRKERRKDKRENRRMKLLFGMFGTALNAFAPEDRIDKVDVKALTDLFSESSSSSSGSSSKSEELSTIASEDSPPTKRLKMKQQRKKSKTQQSQKKRKRS